VRKVDRGSVNAEVIIEVAPGLTVAFHHHSRCGGQARAQARHESLRSDQSIERHGRRRLNRRAFPLHGCRDAALALNF
jgi:hypothetical protein